jgi:hypothetical protein
MFGHFISLPGGVVEELPRDEVPSADPDSSLMRWAQWFEESGTKPFTEGGRRVARTLLPDGREVSTVFLGLDHGFGFGDRPMLFETMIFKDDRAGNFQRRYHTWEEALADHDQICEALTRGELLTD